MPIEGLNVTISPSRMYDQPARFNGVTTSLPHPQQHLCSAVRNRSEMYITPSLSLAGADSTNSGRIFWCLNLDPQMLSRSDAGVDRIQYIRDDVIVCVRGKNTGTVSSR